jgi:Single-strand binding protein family
MFRFTLQGRIGRIDRVKGTDAIVRVSLAADRLVEGKDGQWTKTEWLSAISFDQGFNEKMLLELDVGQSVTLEGRIEPKKRQVGDVAIYDQSFVITRFQLLSKPKTKAKPAQAAQAAA